MERIAAEERWQPAVAILRCFHGIETDAALTLLTEIFDVKRFGHPRQLMSYLGITPTALSAVLPEYLWRFRPSGQYDAIKRSAKNLRT